jgi:hypothetical protein
MTLERDVSSYQRTLLAYIITLLSRFRYHFLFFVLLSLSISCLHRHCESRIAAGKFESLCESKDQPKGRTSKEMDSLVIGSKRKSLTRKESKKKATPVNEALQAVTEVRSLVL